VGGKDGEAFLNKGDILENFAGPPLELIEGYE
jgi:hypothetical protein